MYLHLKFFKETPVASITTGSAIGEIVYEGFLNELMEFAKKLGISIVYKNYCHFANLFFLCRDNSVFAAFIEISIEYIM